MSRNEREQCLARIAKHYEGGTYHRQSAAGTIYILATVLERVDNDLLWCVNSALHPIPIYQRRSGLQFWALHINITRPAYLVRNTKLTTLSIMTRFSVLIPHPPTMATARRYLSTRMIRACVRLMNCDSRCSDIGRFMTPCIIPVMLPANWAYGRKEAVKG